MKKLVLFMLTILLSLGVVMTSVTAEEPALGTYENPITDTCYVQPLSFDGEGAPMVPTVRCFKGGPVSILTPSSSKWLHFTDINTNDVYSYEVTQGGVTGNFMIQLSEKNGAYFIGNEVLPAGSYSLMLSVFKEGTETWYKLADERRALENHPGLFKNIPSNFYIEMSNDGLVLGCNATGQPESMQACTEFLNAVKENQYVSLEFRKYNDNYYSGNYLGGSGNISGDVEKYSWIQGQPKLLMTPSVMSKMFIAENEDVNVRLSQVPGYLGDYITRIEHLTIAGVPGTEQNPFKSCRLERNPSSIHENAFYIVCDNPQDLVGNQNSSTMQIVNNDTNKTYRGFNLYYARINLDGKMEFSNYELESWYIYDDQWNDTYVPAGNYTVYLLKPDETGNNYTWYLLENNIELEQIKKPLPTTAYIKSDETDELVVGCDVTENGCSEWLDKFYATAARPSDEVTNSKFDLSRFMIWSTTDSSGLNFPQTDDDITTIIDKVTTNGQTSALKIKREALVEYGYKAGNYRFEMKTMGYSNFIVENFDLVMATKNTDNIQITITQDVEYPFTVYFKAENDETYEFLKNTSQIFVKIPGVTDSDDNYHIVSQMDCWPMNDAETSKTFYSTAPVSDRVESGKFDIEFASGGYDSMLVEGIDMIFQYFKMVTDAKVVLASNGVQVYSNDMELLNVLAGLKETKYPVPEGDIAYSLSVRAVGENAGNEVVSVWEENLFENQIFTNEITGKSYVLIDGQKLSKYSFNEEKSYQLNFYSNYSGFGGFNSNAFQLSDAYFDVMSEGFNTKDDDEVIDVLGHQNIHVGKHHHHHDDVKHHGVEMPKFAGALVERENERGGFSEDNMSHLGADTVEMTVTVNPLEKGKLDHACEENDVEATDVQFELDLTNIYKSGTTEKSKDEIDELPVEVDMTFNMPSETLGANEKYMLLTEHDGVSELIEIEVDSVTGKGTAKVDKFSPFMVVKVTENVTPVPTPTPTPNPTPTPEVTPTPTPEVTPSQTPTSTPVASTVPNTSDSSHMMMWALLAIVSLIAAIAMTVVKKFQILK